MRIIRFLLFFYFKNSKGDEELETIISACISACVTLLVCIISNRAQQEKTRALMQYKLDELTKKVEKHNSVVERTFLLEEKIKVANHRIEDLEGKVG